MRSNWLGKAWRLACFLAAGVRELCSAKSAISWARSSAPDSASTAASVLASNKSVWPASMLSALVPKRQFFRRATSRFKAALRVCSNLSCAFNFAMTACASTNERPSCCVALMSVSICGVLGMAAIIAPQRSPAKRCLSGWTSASPVALLLGAN